MPCVKGKSKTLERITLQTARRYAHTFRFACTLFRQDMRERFAGSLLGRVWVFIWPLVQLFIYIVIFGKLMGGRFSGDAQVYSYGVYVAAGLICWTCFANTLTRTSRMFMEKRHIMGKVKVNFAVFPLAICLGELLPFAVSCCVLGLVNAFSGWQPSLLLLGYAVLTLYCQQVLAMGLGLVFAICAVFVRDAVEALAVLVQVGFWFTPIVYLPVILPEWIRPLLQLNPMGHAAMAFQNLFVFGATPSLWGLLYLAAAAHLALFGAAFLVRKLEKDIRDTL